MIHVNLRGGETFRPNALGRHRLYGPSDVERNGMPRGSMWAARRDQTGQTGMTFRKTLSGLGAGIGATLTAGIAAAQTMGMRDGLEII